MGYIRVNDFAPKDGLLSVYFKKVKPGKKSDGFAAILDGEVFLIDFGGTKDDEMLRFLLSLREKWLENLPDSAEKETAVLEICSIASHSHPDHIGGMHFILDEPRLRITSFFAPQRSVLSVISPELLPELTMREEQLEDVAERLQSQGLSSEKIFRLPYGKTHSIQPKTGDAHLTLYTAPFDWSEDRPSDSEGMKFLKKYTSPTYKDKPEAGWTNGVLNGNSLWVKIQKGGQSVLITGDQRDSDEMLGRMIRHYGEENFRCDVLKLTHHGDGNYSPYLIETASPKITIFTVERKRAKEETAALCEKVSKPYYLGDGNLILTFDGDSITETMYE